MGVKEDEMKVITTATAGRKRQMVLVPDINPHSFQLLFEKGATGYSFSVRDYSVPNHVTERRASDFGCTAEEIRRKATRIYDGPLLDVTMLDLWHAYTLAINEMHGLRERTGQVISFRPAPGEISTAPFPILNAEAFSALPKAAKSGDVRRISESSQSEDWVTWNLLNLLRRCRPDQWWAELCACAIEANPGLRLPDNEPAPDISFWRTISSPPGYETMSRDRMKRSTDRMIVARSYDSRPVEGNSEIDVMFESSSLVIFVEAKLNSDVSMRTTYDPDRNQIVRNIDCLLESAGDKTPLFWMFVRDTSPARAYTQLIKEYQEHPATLARLLPHRDPALLNKVAAGLTVLTWSDIAGDVCTPDPKDDDQITLIKRELRRRIQ
jgi:hypothetical protein